MPSSNTPQGFGARTLTFIKRLVVTVIVLTLSAATVILLSERNARTFGLDARDGKLVVLKGRMMPMGAELWTPPDSTLADAYAPIDLEGTPPPTAVGVTYDDRDALDRALFGVIEQLARPKVASDNPKELDGGLYLVRRAERLSGLTDEQRLSLKKMKAQVSLYTARLKLEDGQKQIEEALVALKLAADSDSRNGQRANQMILAVEPPAKALIEAVRRAGAMVEPPPEKPGATPLPKSEPSAPQALPSQGEPGTPPPGSPTTR